MKTFIIPLVMLFLFSSLFSAGIAQPRQKMHKGPMKDRVVEKLNLTDEQKEEISDLRSEHQKKMVDLKAELSKAEIDMRNLEENSTPTRSEMISAVEKINSIKNKMSIEKANHKMDVFELLNDEQKKIWMEHKPIRDHMKSKFNKRKMNRCE